MDSLDGCTIGQAMTGAERWPRSIARWRAKTWHILAPLCRHVQASFFRNKLCELWKQDVDQFLACRSDYCGGLAELQRVWTRAESIYWCFPPQWLGTEGSQGHKCVLELLVCHTHPASHVGKSPADSWPQPIEFICRGSVTCLAERVCERQALCAAQDHLICRRVKSMWTGADARNLFLANLAMTSSIRHWSFPFTPCITTTNQALINTPPSTHKSFSLSTLSVWLQVKLWQF